MIIKLRQEEKEPWAVLMGVSEGIGIVHWEILERAVNTTSFCLFLKNMREKLLDRRVVVFMDNLAVHKAATVR